VATVSALSYSSVRAYLECPLRWKFLYVDRLPEAPRGYFSFGRSVHSVLETLLRPLVRPIPRVDATGRAQMTLDEWPGGASVAAGHLPTLEELLGEYQKEWVSEGYTSPDEEERYRDLGVEMLTSYWRTLSEAPPTPVAVEAHLETTWDGIPIHGYIDRIDATPAGGLEIIDYKTTRELSHDDARGSDQLGMYQVLVERNFPRPVESLTLFHLRSLTPLTVPPKPTAELSELYDRVGTARDGIRSNAFEPTPGRQCSRCDFRAMCPEFREVPAAEQERLTALVDRFAQLRAEEQRLEGELQRTAQELHKAAEEHGVHRVAGRRAVALRRREESWEFPNEAVRALVDRYGLSQRLTTLDPAAVLRLTRDPTVEARVRREISETGGRKVRWYWELEETNGADGA
jgi:RecB family exonuclease